MNDRLNRLAAITYRQARRIVIAVVGGTIVLAGAAMLVLPGPGWIVIALGLAILAIEFAFAQRWLKKLKQTAGSGLEYVKGKVSRGRNSGEAQE